MNTSGRITRILHAVFLLVVVGYCLFPIYMMGIKSLKSVREDMFGNPLVILHPRLDWYAGLFRPVPWVLDGVVVPTIPFVVWLKNTAIVFAVTLTLILLTSLMAAYAIGRLHPPGWLWWRRVLFATYLVPPTLLFIPLYRIVFQLRVDDNLLALVLVYPMLALPFCVWLLSAYLHQLPAEVEESAYIEGASRFTAFTRIVLPMSWPVIVAAGIFALGMISSDYMFASVFLPNQFHQTLASGLGTVYVSTEEMSVVAGVNLAALMVVPVCTAFSGAYVRGLTAAMIEGA